MNVPAATRASSIASDPDLPEEVDFSQGRRGGLLPTDPIERARVLEKRVIALQEFGLRLRAAAERVAERARQHGDGYVVSGSQVPKQALPASWRRWRRARERR